MASFIFGGNTGVSSPQELARRRQIADALAARMLSGENAPRSVREAIGQGLGDLGEALAVRRMDKGIDAAQKTGDASAKSVWGNVLASIGGASFPPAPASSDPVDARVSQAFAPNDVYSGFINGVKQGGVTNPYGLAAIAATGRAESAFSPQNAGRTWDDGANNAGGIMSWNGPRLAALQNFVRSKGGSGLGTPEMQAQFLLQENPQLIASLNNAGSLQDAMGLMNDAWRFKGYDQPGNPDAKRRLEYAQAFLPSFQNSTPAEQAIQVASPLPQPGAGQQMAATAPATSAPTAAVASLDTMMPPPPVTPTPQSAYGNGYANGIPSEGFGGAVKGAPAPASAMTQPTMTDLGAIKKGPRAGGDETGAVPATAPSGMPSPFMPFLPAPEPQTPASAAPAPNPFGNSQQLAQATGGIVPTLRGERGPAPQQGGPSLQALMQAASNPFLNETQRAVVLSMLKNRMDPNAGLDAEYKRAQIAKLKADAAKASNPLADQKYGLQPQYGVDADGNPVILQLGNNGVATQTHLPDGVQLSKKPIKLDAGTEWVLLDPITRQPVGTIPKNLAGAEAAKAKGKAQGALSATLPSDMLTSAQTVQQIDQLLANPGLNSIVGPVDQYRPTWTLGDKGRDALARYDQLKGHAFLQAYTMLKGGGQITEVEGVKAENAMARMNRAQSEDDFRQALKDFRDAVVEGQKKLLQKAGVPESQWGSYLPQQQPAGPVKINGYTIEEVQ